MAEADVDSLFEKLGLLRLPKDVSCATTFVAQDSDTIVSAPRADVAPDDALGGTLPRLHFASPEAAQTGAGEPELQALQVLGEGGMGRVLLARQSSLGRDVAVKVLRPGPANAAGARALVHEARTTGSLEHPSVVPIYALAQDAHHQPALVMKRVEGVSWRELIHTPDHPAWARLAPQGRDRLVFHVCDCPLSARVPGEDASQTVPGALPRARRGRSSTQSGSSSALSTARLHEVLVRDHHR